MTGDRTGGLDPKRTARLAGLRGRYPSVVDLERRARARMPRFAYDFLQGGAGDENGLKRNRDALTAIEIVPRYGVDVSRVDVSVELFGRRYNAPIGISPIGFDGMMWPGATESFARAAQANRIPYLAGTLACATIEKVVEWAPDVAWFQLYPLPADDHHYSFELARRADLAGAHVLVATLDIPVRAKRPRDLRNGLSMPFRISAANVADALLAPPWTAGILKHGMPHFANMMRYAGENATREDAARFVQQNVRGGFGWEAIARLRDHWKKPLLVKGVLHPADAERAVQLGLDGVLVSNHGGRQFDAAPAPIDVLPAIVAAVGGRAKVFMDSGIVSGVDILRAIACGADATFAGRAFMLSLAALGDLGAEHMARAYTEELTIALGQSGVRNLAEARTIARRHPGAWTAGDFEVSVGPGAAAPTRERSDHEGS